MKRLFPDNAGLHRWLDRAGERIAFLGLPARMVQGVAIVQAEGRWQAYGHAWAQTLEGGRWTLRDSALAGFPGPVYYMPFAAMDDEGPGYRLTLLRAQGRLPQRIEVLGPEAPAPR